MYVGDPTKKDAVYTQCNLQVNKYALEYPNQQNVDYWHLTP